MTMPGVQTDLVLMQETAREVGRTRDTLQGLLADLMRTVAEMEEKWRGMAGDQFQQSAIAYRRASDLMHEALGDLGLAMSEAGTNLEDHDNQSGKAVEAAGGGFVISVLRGGGQA